MWPLPNVQFSYFSKWLEKEQKNRATAQGRESHSCTKCGGGVVTESCPTLATPWTVAHQAPLSMEFFRQEYWSGLPFLLPGDLPDPGIKLGSPAFQADSLPSEPPEKPEMGLEPMTLRLRVSCSTDWARQAAAKVKVAQLCPSLCDPMDYTAHGILQARILEWVAFPFSRGSSQPRDQTWVFCTAGRFFTIWATNEGPDLKFIKTSVSAQLSKVKHNRNEVCLYFFGLVLLLLKVLLYIDK